MPPPSVPPPDASPPTTIARTLIGTWVADYGASSGRGALLTALGLSGLERVTADRLIEGMRITVAGSTFSCAFLTVVPFFSVTESASLRPGAAPTRGKRRDGKAGTQTVAAAVDGDSLIITLAWGEPNAATLTETYRLAPDGRALTVESAIKRKDGVTAAAKTLYRRTEAWKPRYTFPGGGGTARRAILLAGLALSSASAANALPSLAPPPPPPAFPRRTLNRALAVLLLRSCYDGVDAMDVGPMDDWQARFWRARAAAWEGYIEARANAGASPARPPQGDVTDAAYFDFISWVQWGSVDVALVEAVTTARDGTTPPGFDERCDPETETPCPESGKRHVERGAPLPATVAGARAEFWDAAGNRALANLRAGFQGVQFDGVPSVNPTDASTAAAALQALAGELVKGGYSFSADVKADAATLTLTCAAPADLYGVRRRLAAGTPPNMLAAVVGSALLSGVVEGAPVVTATDTATTATWRLKAV